MAPLVYYQTDDDVNFELAATFAVDCGSRMVRARGGPPAVDDEGAAWLHDFDHLSDGTRRVLLDVLRAAPPSTPVAVHGYSLEDGQRLDLRSRGIVVATSLEPSLVRTLCARTPRAESSIPLDGAETGTDEVEPEDLCRMIRATASRAHSAIRRTRQYATEEFHELLEQLDHIRSALEYRESSRYPARDELAMWLARLTRQLCELPAQNPSR